MGREDSFLKGFEKRASMLTKLKRTATVAAVGGGLAYGAGKVIQKSEDPEQAQLRVLRKAKALPYQQV